MKRNMFFLAALIAVLFALQGCGGGGGGGDTPPPANNNQWDSMVWDRDNWG